MLASVVHIKIEIIIKVKLRFPQIQLNTNKIIDETGTAITYKSHGLCDPYIVEYTKSIVAIIQTIETDNKVIKSLFGKFAFAVYFLS